MNTSPSSISYRRNLNRQPRLGNIDERYTGREAIERALAYDLEETVRIKRLNLDLMDALELGLLYMLGRHTQPDWSRIQSLVDRVRALHVELYPSPTNLGQPSKPTDEGTEQSALRLASEGYSAVESCRFDAQSIGSALAIFKKARGQSRRRWARTCFVGSCSKSGTATWN